MRQLLREGNGLVLDTETTDLTGVVCEIAAVDLSGATVIDTLVRAREPIHPGAQAVHGISDADLVDAPTWEEVLPELLEATRGRTVLAYNSPFDRAAIARSSTRCGMSAEHMVNPLSWMCLMRARSAIEGARWRRLDAGHRALGDTLAALDVLHDLAA